MINIPLFATSGDIVVPPSGLLLDGFVPLQRLPAEYLNYEFNGLSQAGQEIVSVITAAGLTPASGLLNQLLSGLAVNPKALVNCRVTSSVSANALTISLRQRAVADPAVGSGIVSIPFRSSTVAGGAYNVRSVTTALTLVIPSGATMGFTNGVMDRLYVYAIDNAGTVELAVSTESLWDEGTLWDTTALSTGSDSRTVLYSTVARTGVPIRFLGRLTLTEATAGTWATAASEGDDSMSSESGVISAEGSSGGITTATSVTQCSIVIPPGTWDISGGYAFVPTASTVVTEFTGAITSRNNDLSGLTSFMTPDQKTGEMLQRIPLMAASATPGAVSVGQPFATYRLINRVQITLYVVVQAAFSVSTMVARGWIQARRIAR